MIPEVEGTRPWGPRVKGSPSVSKNPKPPIQLLQLLKNSPREAKRADFRYILLGPPGPTQEMELMGPGGEGPSRSPPPPVSPAMCVVLCRLRRLVFSLVFNRHSLLSARSWDRPLLPAKTLGALENVSRGTFRSNNLLPVLPHAPACTTCNGSLQTPEKVVSSQTLGRMFVCLWDDS